MRFPTRPRPPKIHGQGLEPSTFLCASVLGLDARSGSQCLKAFPDSPSNRSFLSKFLQFSLVKHATRAFSAKDAEPKNYFPPKFWGSTYSFHFDHRQPWVFTKSCTSSRPCFFNHFTLFGRLRLCNLETPKFCGPVFYTQLGSGFLLRPFFSTCVRKPCIWKRFPFWGKVSTFF